MTDRHQERTAQAGALADENETKPGKPPAVEDPLWHIAHSTAAIADALEEMLDRDADADADAAVLDDDVIHFYRGRD